MKMNSLSVLCLLLLLFHTHFTLAKKGGGSFGKSFSSKKFPTSNRGTNTGQKNNQGGYPKQPGQTNQGGYPPQPGRPGYPGGYPQQGGGGGYHNQYPARGSPYGGGYGGHGGYGSHGGYGGQGGYGGYGGYGGGYINQNPNNKILSPHYGGSFGYGGYGGGRGSPFSNSVQAMGVYPQDNSRGFGRSAVMAAAGGAMAGMALGYGLGRFPRPPFHFHNAQEEHYYNHYMYRKYGVKSTDNDDYSRDYKYSQPPRSYDSFMDSCMKRTDVLPEENQKPKNKPAAATTTTTTTVVTSAPDTGTSSNKTETNSTAAEQSSASASTTPRSLNRPEASPVPPASQAVSEADDDDTVSVVEIGYPALIEQLKARRCLELYMVYSEKYLKRETGGVQGLEMGLKGLLAVVTSTILMLLNSNILMLPH
ncbi:AT-rich interactive domain-containing protein 1B-like [Seriola aureovittata]|uniref:AT-rich interactive domain-containing protein 1B-like n=1 Tax=Seriola aureovittata TaxID=2871759 RepID=UPI0024BD9A76|nr:AT-rich interactive domain-containing protein 1B-like [Seriola aureovittata]